MKIALITAFSCVAKVHQQTLERLFGQEIELQRYSYDNGNISERIEADVYLISIYQIYLNVRKCIPENAKTIIINNTITEEQYQQVAALPAGMTVLLVNYSVEMTMDTISLFHQLGLNHLEFVPCYPGVATLPHLDVAVTPGESHHVPSFVKRVLDIGDRVMDARTIIDIATALGLERLLKEERFVEYFKSIRMSPDSVTFLFDRTNILESQLSSLLDVLDDGIVIIEKSGIVYSGNRKAREVLGLREEFAGMRAVDLIPGIHFEKVLKTSAEVDYTLVKIQSRDVSVKVVPVIAKGEIRGALAIVNTFDEKEKNQQRLRSQLLGKGHRSRYTFDDIVTMDESFLEVKQLARKKAKSDASVLILGETGTGKELFAHAIHNASRRKGWQLVAVNCAALPESLLESELFGYEEGAFTGARKGGKPGLFELAHKGTIFLDEIGEMNLGLQARLLRVLENREVMRIGSDRMIHVDIRIITATNKDLWSLVEEGRFRKDLYYRLNVLPIEIPPLRERRLDILFLLGHLLKTMNLEVEFTDDAKDVFEHYPWHGNIRELKNCAEYLVYLDKRVIEAKDLAPILKRPQPATGAEENTLDKRLESMGPEREHCLFLLECLYANHQQKLRAGRRTLCQSALQQDRFLTEGQIRKLLLQMESHGLVHLTPGRGGTTITQNGIELLQKTNRRPIRTA
jgi:sigma-54 dependent transcriptional regulator, acetoin dehydrogenase operon transcriptional activator AcoR